MTNDDPFVLLVCNDLFFGSKVTGAASMAGVRLVVDSSATLERITDAACCGVILDLNHPTATSATVSDAAPDGLKLLAFGPHVHTELLEAAKSQNFETVTRGQFDRSPADILGSFKPAQ